MPLAKTTFSGISKFASCPRAWYLSEHLGLQLREDPRVGPLPFGSRIHTALELWTKSQWQADIGQIWDKLTERERSIYDERGWVWGTSEDKENRMGHAMLTGYVDWLDAEQALLDWKVVEVEGKHYMPLTITLPDGRDVEVVLASKLDLHEVHTPTGLHYVDDYKTAGSLTPDSVQVTMDKMQGPLYVLQIRRANPDAIVHGVIFTILRKVLRGPSSKPPYFARLIKPLTVFELKAAETNAKAWIGRIASVSDELDAGRPHWDAVPYNVSWQCNTCPFRRPCEMMREGRMRAAEDQLADLFTVGDPMQRYTEPATVV